MIQIKDMKMPKRCAECKICVNQETNDYGTHGKCLLQDKRVDCLVWSRDKNCPLTEREGQEMSKYAFVETAERDMDLEADWVVNVLCDYAEKNQIECDFIFETFLKAFRKKVKAESEINQTEVIIPGNCLICGKELTEGEGIFVCNGCFSSAIDRIESEVKV